MLPVPADKAFESFVTDRRRKGLSSASIAGALNNSQWADPLGARWNFRQVELLCWSADVGMSAAPIEIDDAAAGGSALVDERVSSSVSCTRDDCEFHRLQRLLRSILSWSPFDPRAARMISTSRRDGASMDTIAARLNRNGVRPPTGRRWSAQLVRVLTGLYGFERELAIDLEHSHGAFDNVAA